MKLGLGTVQFGLDYGVSNPAGKTPEEEVGRILELAAASGIALLDTAAQYGDAEAVLGRCLPRHGSFQIVTKTPSFRSDTITAAQADELARTLRQSLERLGQPSVYGLLIHHCDDLFAPGGDLLFARMAALKAEGRVRKIGVSAYRPDQVDRALAQFPLDLVQAPFSALDQRLLHGGQLQRLRDRGVEFHARSVFLQGLLLMEPGRLADYFSPWHSLLDSFRQTAADAGLSPQALALRFVADHPLVARAVCGVNNAAQLEELLAACRQAGAMPSLERFAQADAALLDPSRWPK